MEITIDPNKEHTELDHTYIKELCGLIPIWLIDIPETSDVKQGLENCYGFGKLFKMTGHTTLSNGTYIYPVFNEDECKCEAEILHPLIKYDRKQEIIYQYHYGIITIVPKDKSESFTTRMD